MRDWNIPARGPTTATPYPVLDENSAGVYIPVNLGPDENYKAPKGLVTLAHYPGLAKETAPGVGALGGSSPSGR